MSRVTVRQLFEVGAHFGHRPCFWNPKLAPYIYGKHNGIHIINLDKTMPLLTEALDFISKTAGAGGKILFVGTKKAATSAVEKQAQRCEMPYVNFHWLGGFLTNFKTVKASIKSYNELKVRIENNGLAKLTKKDAQRTRRRYNKLGRNFEGICELETPPAALFVIDVGHEEIAVKEAAKLNIPIVAIIDTNNSLDHIDYPIPANDDSLRSIELYTNLVADAVIEGIENAKEESAHGAPFAQPEQTLIETEPASATATEPEPEDEGADEPEQASVLATATEPESEDEGEDEIEQASALATATEPEPEDANEDEPEQASALATAAEPEPEDGSEDEAEQTSMFATAIEPEPEDKSKDETEQVSMLATAAESEPEDESKGEGADESKSSSASTS